MGREAYIARKTGETDISVKLNLDGTGKTQINTGIGFFNHMLDSFARHGLFDLEVSADGDLDVDSHHTIEDTGMNRDSLVRARRRLIIRFLKDYKAHQKCGNGKEFCDDWEMLKESMNYPSLYDELIAFVSSSQ